MITALDRKIVEFLRRDGRMPFREIARQLDISEGQVRKRVSALLDSGWMRILAITDPLRLGVPILCTTYLQVSPDRLNAVTDRLAASNQVRYVALGVGHANVVVESIHADLKDLYAFTQSHLHVEGVVKYEMMQVAEVRKSVWDWDVPGGGESGQPSGGGAESAQDEREAA